MRPTKIQDEHEVLEWIEAGRTFKWMADEYLRTYNLQVSPTTFSNFRSRMGLEPRTVRNDDLVPWAVQRHHRWTHPVMMLRAEARRRTGLSVSDPVRLDSWLARLKAENAVVHYDPDTDEGFFYVPRRTGIDIDLIREPDKKTKLRRAVD